MIQALISFTTMTIETLAVAIGSFLGTLVFFVLFFYALPRLLFQETWNDLKDQPLSERLSKGAVLFIIANVCCFAGFWALCGILFFFGI